MVFYYRGNKYYKLFKDSIIYEGYNEFEKGNKHLDFSTCQVVKDFYRSKKVSLEKINRFDVLHKDDDDLLKFFLNQENIVRYLFT